MLKRKIGIIGAGHVGSHIAFLLAAQGLANEIILYDILTAKAESQVLDLRDAISYLPYECHVAAGVPETMNDASIIINATGPGRDTTPHAPNRLALLESGVLIAKEVASSIKKSGFNGIIISISNPCDIIAAYLQYLLDWPAQKIMGTGTLLETARLKAKLANHYDVAQNSIHAMILGEHGDSSLVAWSHATIGGIKLDEYNRNSPTLPLDKSSVLKQVHVAGGILMRGKGSTEFGIASVACLLVKAILCNEHKILPVSVKFHNLYGINDAFTSIPVCIGESGIERYFELELSQAELSLLQTSAEITNTYFKKTLATK